MRAGGVSALGAEFDLVLQTARRQDRTGREHPPLCALRRARSVDDRRRLRNRQRLRARLHPRRRRHAPGAAHPREIRHRRRQGGARPGDAGPRLLRPRAAIVLLRPPSSSAHGPPPAAPPAGAACGGGAVHHALSCPGDRLQGAGLRDSARCLPARAATRPPRPSRHGGQPVVHSALVERAGSDRVVSDPAADRVLPRSSRRSRGGTTDRAARSLHCCQAPHYRQVYRGAARPLGVEPFQALAHGIPPSWGSTPGRGASSGGALRRDDPHSAPPRRQGGRAGVLARLELRRTGGVRPPRGGRRLRLRVPLNHPVRRCHACRTRHGLQGRQRRRSLRPPPWVHRRRERGAWLGRDPAEGECDGAWVDACRIVPRPRGGA
mmetsp:Transcript_64711/g.154508  ORF Transcript_64711/g.154508 Transcript_64711/m.154508 type:complete len:378 (+) Transcript_64711:354-1487(+)